MHSNGLEAIHSPMEADLAVHRIRIAQHARELSLADMAGKKVPQSTTQTDRR